MTRQTGRLTAGGLLVLAMTSAAAAQAQPPTFDHLKCYAVKADKAVLATGDLLPLQPQLPPERGCRIKGPVLFCAPVDKVNVQPPPPGFSPGPQEIDHLCYKIACRKPLPPTLTVQDQFGTFMLAFKGARLLCTPAIKVGVPTTTIPTTTTIVTTTTTTTTTTIQCRFDPARNGCVGDCPTAGGTTALCHVIGPQQCGCAPPTVCCQCSGGPAPMCFDSNQPCPPNCTALPFAECNPSTGQCGCALCRDANTCTTIPCSATNPCPSNLVCDTHCPGQCPSCCFCPPPGGSVCAPPGQCPANCKSGSACANDQQCLSSACNQPAGSCSAFACVKTDGTTGTCHPSPLGGACGCF